jgi:hypothetical protein
LTRKTRVDPETGLTISQLIAKKMNDTLSVVDEGGLTLRQRSQLKQQVVGDDGLTSKQRAAAKARKTMIDRGTDKHSGPETFRRRYAKDPEFRKAILNKRRIALDTPGPDGMTTREKLSRKHSERMRSIHPDGMTYSQRARRGAILKGKGVRYSKEAGEVFDLLQERFPDLEMLYGPKGEYVIVDPQTKRPFFYDLFVKSLKLIVEYNGERWHPNRSVMTEQEWKNWKSPFSRKSADEIEREDVHKRWLAINRGFICFTIWSQTREQDLDALIRLIQTRIDRGIPTMMEGDKPL